MTTRTRPTRREITLTVLTVAAIMLVVVVAPWVNRLMEEHARTTNLANLAAAQHEYAAVIDLANDARDRLMHAHSNTLTFGDPPDLAIWQTCGDSYEYAWDSPKTFYWLAGTGGTIEPRQPTVDLIEPVLQSYLDDGWTLGRDRRDLWQLVTLYKDGYSVQIEGVSQEDLDYPLREAGIRIDVYSPCIPSPNNLTEWDREHPGDFSFATQEPPDPTW
jgi:hypothetical protein